MPSNFSFKPLLTKGVFTSCCMALALSLTACGGGSSGGGGGSSSSGGNSNGGSNGGGTTPPPVSTEPSFRIFAANGGVNTGIELWKTDGTTAGTVLVKDINDSGDSEPTSFVMASKDKWFFIANDGVNGRELWTTDGTEAGTKMVKDIRSGATSSSIQELTAFDGGVAFSVFTSVFPYAGSKLWVSDGTEAGTHAVTNISPNANNDSPRELTLVGDKLYFKATGPTGDELYVSDGSDAGTRLVKDIQTGTIPNTPIQLSGNPQFLTSFNNGVFFTAPVPINPNTATGPSIDLEPWYSDGTTTRILKHINPTAGSMPSGWTVSGDRLYFVANDGGSGTALWVTDGTGTGTKMVADPNNTSVTLNNPLNPRTITSVGDRDIFFVAGNNNIGMELWFSDGTTAGTIPLEINPGTSGGYIEHVTAFGKKAIFVAYISNVQNAPIKARAQARAIALQTYQTQLWISDGTVAGTQKLKDLHDTERGKVEQIVPAIFDDNKLLISVDDGVKGIELWITDGTEAGTELVKDINPDALSSNPTFIEVVN